MVISIDTSGYKYEYIIDFVNDFRSGEMKVLFCNYVFWVNYFMQTARNQ